MKRSGWFLAVQLAVVVSFVCLQSPRLVAQEDHAERARAARAASGTWQEEPWMLIGVWNLDFDMSPRFGGPPPQARILKYWLEGDHLKHTVNLVNAKGEHTLGGWEIDSNFKTISAGTTTVKKVDRYTSLVIGHNKEGKLTSILTRVAWKDGKHLTFVRQRPDASGQLEVYAVENFTKADPHAE